MPVRVSSRKIHIESGSDKVRGRGGKMYQRARKRNRRAIKARERRKGRVNKDDHTTKISYKPKVPKQEKATKSRLGLDHELKKIEDARIRAIYESHEEMMEMNALLIQNQAVQEAKINQLVAAQKTVLGS